MLKGVPQVEYKHPDTAWKIILKGMDFSLFKNAHDTIRTFGGLKRGMNESFVTYCKALYWHVRGDTGMSH